ncbi:MAG: nucleotidyltransferase domain-containing protein [Thermotogota bacterium]|nr:nucleotidyltransferase domain-containing protein [Thermotogota bacterium]
MDKVPESVRKIINDYIRKISKEIKIEKIILFGSHAKGTTHQYSDVDLAVFSNHFKKNNRIENLKFLIYNAMDFDIDLEPQPFTLDDYENPEGFIEEIIRTGIEISEVKN